MPPRNAVPPRWSGAWRSATTPTGCNSRRRPGPTSGTSSASGKRGLRKRAIYNLEFALLADGVPREQVYPLLATRAGADRAFAKLGQLKPYIQWWRRSAAGSGWPPATW